MNSGADVTLENVKEHVQTGHMVATLIQSRTFLLYKKVPQASSRQRKLLSALIWEFIPLDSIKMLMSLESSLNLC